MLKKKNKYVVAVAGAACIAGRELVEILAERNFPVGNLVLLDSEEAAGERIEFRGNNIVVRQLAKEAFAGADLAFFFTGKESSLQFAPFAVTAGAVVIDGTGAFSTAANAPLVVPEINPQELTSHHGIIASPSSMAICLSLALKPLLASLKMKKIVVTALLSVSGDGKRGMDELAQQTVALLNFRDVEHAVYPHQIAFNCLPQYGVVLEDGRTQAETDIARDTARLLGNESIPMSVMTALIPVFRGDAASVFIETETAIEQNELRALLAGAPGVFVFDDPRKNIYPMPVDLVGKDEVYVGRIIPQQSGCSFWLAADNVRKGCALNMVQIAENMVQ